MERTGAFEGGDTDGDLDAEEGPNGPEDEEEYEFDPPGSRGSSGSAGRRRGQRGGGNKQNYRGGTIPKAPAFSGDRQTDPRCYTTYVRAVEIWKRKTKQQAPPEELVLYLIGELTGDAALDIEYTP